MLTPAKASDANVSEASAIAAATANDFALFIVLFNLNVSELLIKQMRKPQRSLRD
jgi:hypothetical protein